MDNAAPLFRTITASDWRNAITMARARRNRFSPSVQIQKHPVTPEWQLPGDNSDADGQLFLYEPDP